MFGGNPIPSVVDGQQCAITVASHLDDDGCILLSAAITDCVADKVVRSLKQLSKVARDRREAVLNLEFDGAVALLDQGRSMVRCQARDFAEIDCFARRQESLG